MNEVIKNSLWGIVSSLIIAAIAASVSIFFSGQQQARDNAILIQEIEKKVSECHRRCERIEDDFYRPAWRDD